ncbi:MAG: hypothetical protein J1F07_08260 [Muribaculaceae bacterium]|nr:hypothetical protein [Muribaculaceae bacterium]
MNKFFSSCLIAAALSTATAASAQEVVEVVSYTATVENPYLPQKGDFAFGVDLVPIIKTIGGAFSSSNKYGDEKFGGTPFTYDTEDMYLKPNVSIMGKYMITNKWAAKVNIGLHVRNTSTSQFVEDQLGLYLDPNSNAQVVDKRKITESGCTFMLGAEYRLGHRRVQGVFGFGLLAGFSTKSAKYTYGNQITELNRTPANAFNAAGPQPTGYRITSQNYDGPNACFGGYGSVGIEWFVGKKIALGASVDLYAYGSWTSRAVVHSEGFNEAYQAVEKRTDLVSPGNGGASFGTDNLGGSLYTIFYF